MTVEIITDFRSKIGEGPLWHPIEKALYWVDIPEGKVIRFDPFDDNYEICFSGEPVSGITVQSDGALLIFLQKGVIVRLQKGKLTVILENIKGFQGFGLNDMIADPLGRVFWGSIPDNLFSGKKECGLYRIDTDGSAALVADDIGVSNGLGFSPTCDKLYYTDTFMRRIYVYNYDKQSGNLGERSVLVEFSKEEGEPDGMTVDAQGYVWTALWGSGSVVRFTPQGTEDRRVDFPAQKVSSVCFGGNDYNEMYVTSAIAGPPADDESELAGALFRIRGAIKGVPEFFSRILI